MNSSKHLIIANKSQLEKWLLNNSKITAEDQELIVETLNDYFNQQHTQKELLNSAIRILNEVCENWDNIEFKSSEVWE